jgi:hypothetical protein
MIPIFFQIFLGDNIGAMGPIGLEQQDGFHEL